MKKLFFTIGLLSLFCILVFASEASATETQEVTNDSNIYNSMQVRSGVGRFSMIFSHYPPGRYWNFQWGLGTLVSVSYVGGGQYIGHYAVPQ